MLPWIQPVRLQVVVLPAADTWGRAGRLDTARLAPWSSLCLPFRRCPLIHVFSTQLALFACSLPLEERAPLAATGEMSSADGRAGVSRRKPMQIATWLQALKHLERVLSFRARAMLLQHGRITNMQVDQNAKCALCPLRWAPPPPPCLSRQHVQFGRTRFKLACTVVTRAGPRPRSPCRRPRSPTKRTMDEYRLSADVIPQRRKRNPWVLVGT